MMSWKVCTDLEICAILSYSNAIIWLEHEIGSTTSYFRWICTHYSSIHSFIHSLIMTVAHQSEFISNSLLYCELSKLSPMTELLRLRVFAAANNLTSNSWPKAWNGPASNIIPDWKFGLFSTLLKERYLSDGNLRASFQNEYVSIRQFILFPILSYCFSSLSYTFVYNLASLGTPLSVPPADFMYDMSTWHEQFR